jgi:thymidylate synthase (FAD)
MTEKIESVPYEQQLQLLRETIDQAESENRLLRARIEQFKPWLELPIREPVLDRGYVELIDFMGDDDAPVDAARVSFAKTAANYSKEQNDKLTKYLIDHHHGTPFEMVTLKFRVKAPVITWWQWVRHRIASYNFVSGRYVEIDDTDVYKPMKWRLQSKSNKQGSAPGEYVSEESNAAFNARRDQLYEQCFKLYQDMLDAGVAKEEARLTIPFAACYYEAIFQINARSLMNFLMLREDSHAQEEIRVFANAMRKILTQTHIRLFGKGE